MDQRPNDLNSRFRAAPPPPFRRAAPRRAAPRHAKAAARNAEGTFAVFRRQLSPAVVAEMPVAAVRANRTSRVAAAARLNYPGSN